MAALRTTCERLEGVLRFSAASSMPAGSGTIGLWAGLWWLDLHRERDREVHSDDRGLAWPKVCEKYRGRTIYLTTGALDDVAIAVIRQPMHHERSDLAEDSLRKVARSLRREADVQAELSSLARDELFSGAQANGALLVTDGSSGKVVSQPAIRARSR